MNFRFILLLTVLSVFSLHCFSQTQKDTIFAPEAVIPVVIDGAATDDVWSKSDWKPMAQVWIPYAAKVSATDFSGKYKMAWDANYLYVLVEVVDDVLSDYYPNPLQNWWDDDCVEVFLDENRSKGYHEKGPNANNAFAYHISTKYDAIDEDANGAGVNYKNNIIVKMTTTAPHTYLWEIAIKVYDATFTAANPELSRVKLTAQKLMGFSVAYCDNDGGTTRQNFIGSMYMTSDHANDNYITADYFGSLLLKANTTATSAAEGKKISSQLVQVFPNPAQNQIRLQRLNDSSDKMVVEIQSMTGALIKTTSFDQMNQMLEMGDVLPGLYLMTISSNQAIQTERIIKQ